MRIRFTLVLILVEVYSMSVVAFLRKSIRRDLISRRCASSLFPPQHQQVQQAFLTYTSKFVDIPDVDGSERAMHYLDLYPEPGTVFEEGKPPIVLLGGASQVREWCLRGSFSTRLICVLQLSGPLQSVDFTASSFPISISYIICISINLIKTTTMLY